LLNNNTYFDVNLIAILNEGCFILGDYFDDLKRLTTGNSAIGNNLGNASTSSQTPASGNVSNNTPSNNYSTTKNANVEKKSTLWDEEKKIKSPFGFIENSFLKNSTTKSLLENDSVLSGPQKSLLEDILPGSSSSSSVRSVGSASSISSSGPVSSTGSASSVKVNDPFVSGISAFDRLKTLSSKNFSNTSSSEGTFIKSPVKSPFVPPTDYDKDLIFPTKKNEQTVSQVASSQPKVSSSNFENLKSSKTEPVAPNLSSGGFSPNNFSSTSKNATSQNTNSQNTNSSNIASSKIPEFNLKSTSDLSVTRGAFTGQVSIAKDNLSSPTDGESKNNSDFLNLPISDSPNVCPIVPEVQPLYDNNLKTMIDDIFDLLEQYNKIEFEKLIAATNADYESIEKILKFFENEGIVEIIYSPNIMQKSSVNLKKPLPSKTITPPVGKVIEQYSVVVDFVPANISIITVNGEARPVYSIIFPAIGKYTRYFLKQIKEEVAENIVIELDDLMDPKKIVALKERFFSGLSVHLVNYFPKTSKDVLNVLNGIILHEMYGLGDLEIIMGDDMLEELAINSAKTPLTVYHKVHGWLKTNYLIPSEEEILNYSAQIGRRIGREITNLSPILDAHLLSGDRVNATLYPISSEGNTITIRRFARKPWTMLDFIGKAHTMSSEMAALLWLAMQYELNIIIAGGTASGKTSALNTLLALVPPYHRIISIEDVREIILPSQISWNWIPLVTRSANPEGLGEVTMLDLMVSSLRMRPDRIIVGEIRRKKEAEVLMEAIETGHSIYSTIHANSAYQVLRRLGEPPINIPLMQIELLDLILVQYRDRKTNKRRTYEIAEIEQTSSGQGLQVNTIYKWVPRTDTWERLNKPSKMLTLLNMHTGMTEEDIYKEIQDRALIFDWMKKSCDSDLDTIGNIMRLFYSDPEAVKKMARENAELPKVNLQNQKEVFESSYSSAQKTSQNSQQNNSQKSIQQNSVSQNNSSQNNFRQINSLQNNQNNTTQNLNQPNLTQPNSNALNSNVSSLTQSNSTQPNSNQFNSNQPNSNQLNSTQSNSNSSRAQNSYNFRNPFLPKEELDSNATKKSAKSLLESITNSLSSPQNQKNFSPLPQIFSDTPPTLNSVDSFNSNFDAKFASKFSKDFKDTKKGEFK
jgi:flagellar protein FlaI